MTDKTINDLIEMISLVSGSLNTKILALPNENHTHDSRYFTETELNNGQLDNRYYTDVRSGKEVTIVYAATAGSALRADHAATAGSALRADTVGKADLAGFAERAGKSEYATSAGSAPSSISNAGIVFGGWATEVFLPSVAGTYAYWITTYNSEGRLSSIGHTGGVANTKASVFPAGQEYYTTLQWLKIA